MNEESARRHRLHNQPILLHIEIRITRLRSNILQDIYDHVDHATAAIVDFCAEAYSIYCEAKFDSDTYTELLLAMRDQPGGKERPIKQFVYYIISQRDLPYLMVQARNIMIAVLEKADESHQQWFPSLNMPPEDVVAEKIREHKGPTKIAGDWLTERSKRSRIEKHQRDTATKETERQNFAKLAKEQGKTPEQLAAEIAAKAQLDKLIDAIRSMTKRIPEMISLGLAVPTTLTFTRPQPLLMCVADDTLYEIAIDRAETSAARQLHIEG